MAGGFFTTSTTCEAQKATCLLTVHHLCQPSFGSLNCCPDLKTTLSVDKLSSSAACSTPGSLNLSRGIPPALKKPGSRNQPPSQHSQSLVKKECPLVGPVRSCSDRWQAQPRTKRPARCPPAEDPEAAFGFGLFFSVRGETKKEQQESSPDCAVTAFLPWEAHQRINLRASDGSKVDGDIRCFLKGL